MKNVTRMLLIGATVSMTVSGCSVTADSTTSQVKPGEIEVHTTKVPAGNIGDTNISTYPGVESRASIEGKDVSWNTPDSVEKVIAFYSSELPAKGWQINETWTQKVIADPGQTRLVAQKGTTVIEVQIGPDPAFPGKTVIDAPATELQNFLQSNPILQP